MLLEEPEPIYLDSYQHLYDPRLVDLLRNRAPSPSPAPEHIYSLAGQPPGQTPEHIYDTPYEPNEPIYFEPERLYDQAASRMLLEEPEPIYLDSYQHLYDPRLVDLLRNRAPSPSPAPEHIYSLAGQPPGQTPEHIYSRAGQPPGQTPEHIYDTPYEPNEPIYFEPERLYDQAASRMLLEEPEPIYLDSYQHLYDPRLVDLLRNRAPSPSPAPEHIYSLAGPPPPQSFYELIGQTPPQPITDVTLSPSSAPRPRVTKSVQPPTPLADSVDQGALRSALEERYTQLQRNAFNAAQDGATLGPRAMSQRLKEWVMSVDAYEVAMKNIDDGLDPVSALTGHARRLRMAGSVDKARAFETVAGSVEKMMSGPKFVDMPADFDFVELYAKTAKTYEDARQASAFGATRVTQKAMGEVDRMAREALLEAMPDVVDAASASRMTGAEAFAHLKTLQDMAKVRSAMGELDALRQVDALDEALGALQTNSYKVMADALEESAGELGRLTKPLDAAIDSVQFESVLVRYQEFAKNGHETMMMVGESGDLTNRAMFQVVAYEDAIAQVRKGYDPTASLEDQIKVMQASDKMDVTQVMAYESVLDAVRRMIRRPDTPLREGFDSVLYRSLEQTKAADLAAERLGIAKAVGDALSEVDEMVRSTASRLGVDATGLEGPEARAKLAEALAEAKARGDFMRAEEREEALFTLDGYARRRMMDAQALADHRRMEVMQLLEYFEPSRKRGLLEELSSEGLDPLSKERIKGLKHEKVVKRVLALYTKLRVDFHKLALRQIEKGVDPRPLLEDHAKFFTFSSDQLADIRAYETMSPRPEQLSEFDLDAVVSKKVSEISKAPLFKMKHYHYRHGGRDESQAFQHIVGGRAEDGLRKGLGASFAVLTSRNKMNSDVVRNVIAEFGYAEDIMHRLPKRMAAMDPSDVLRFRIDGIKDTKGGIQPPKPPGWKKRLKAKRKMGVGAVKWGEGTWYADEDAYLRDKNWLDFDPDEMRSDADRNVAVPRKKTEKNKKKRVGFATEVQVSDDTVRETKGDAIETYQYKKHRIHTDEGVTLPGKESPSDRWTEMRRAEEDIFSDAPLPEGYAEDWWDDFLRGGSDFEAGRVSTDGTDDVRAVVDAIPPGTDGVPPASIDDAILPGTDGVPPASIDDASTPYEANRNRLNAGVDPQDFARVPTEQPPALRPKVEVEPAGALESDPALEVGRQAEQDEFMAVADDTGAGERPELLVDPPAPPMDVFDPSDEAGEVAKVLREVDPRTGGARLTDAPPPRPPKPEPPPKPPRPSSHV
jgi:hypothetical protein